MRERGARRGPAAALRRPLARPRPGRGAGRRRAGDPAARRRTTGETVDRRPGAGRRGRRQNEELDDLVLLRSDGTPTYMLAVVVDDHDMGVTHVIRGDDHLTNAARQTQIYQALGWAVPEMAHIPLIHGPDGAKLSKRHGALGVDAYRDAGLPARGAAQLPAAARLEPRRRRDHLDRARRSSWFDLDGVGRAPARFDFAKLENLNGHYIRAGRRRASWSALEAILPRARRERGLAGALSRRAARELLAAHAGAEGARQDPGRAARQAPLPLSPQRPLAARRQGRERCSTDGGARAARRRSRRRSTAAPTGRRRRSRRRCARFAEAAGRQARPGRAAAARRADRPRHLAAASSR